MAKLMVRLRKQRSEPRQEARRIQLDTFHCLLVELLSESSSSAGSLFEATRWHFNTFSFLLEHSGNRGTTTEFFYFWSHLCIRPL